MPPKDKLTHIEVMSRARCTKEAIKALKTLENSLHISLERERKNYYPPISFIRLVVSILETHQKQFDFTNLPFDQPGLYNQAIQELNILNRYLSSKMFLLYAEISDAMRHESLSEKLRKALVEVNQLIDGVRLLTNQQADDRANIILNDSSLQAFQEFTMIWIYGYIHGYHTDELSLFEQCDIFTTWLSTITHNPPT